MLQGSLHAFQILTDIKTLNKAALTVTRDNPTSET